MPAAASDISDIKPVVAHALHQRPPARAKGISSPASGLSVASAAERVVDHVFMLDTRCAGTTENVGFLSERR